MRRPCYSRNTGIGTPGAPGGPWTNWHRPNFLTSMRTESKRLLKTLFVRKGLLLLGVHWQKYADWEQTDQRFWNCNACTGVTSSSYERPSAFWAQMGGGSLFHRLHIYVDSLWCELKWCVASGHWNWSFYGHSESTGVFWPPRVSVRVGTAHQVRQMSGNSGHTCRASLCYAWS